MPLDLGGFNTPEQKFEGLYQAGDAAERRRYQDAQMQEKRDVTRLASSRFLDNYLDQKAFLSGTAYDPMIVKGLQAAMQEGSELALKGADMTTIMMALNPKVSQISNYSQKAKQIAANKKEAIDLLKGQKGIDLRLFSDAYDNAAFYSSDDKGNRKLKSIEDIDPDKNIADLVLRDADVFTREGVDDWVAKSGKETNSKDIYTYNKAGGLKRSKVEMTSPTFMMSDVDEKGAHVGFVPNYEIATDDGEPIHAPFNGGSKTAPVRMVTDDVWKSLSPNALSYLRQEARKYAKAHGIDPTSQAAFNFAKAIAYDELNRSGKGYSSMKEVAIEHKPSPQEIRINFPNYGKGGSKGDPDEVKINDIYKRIGEQVKDFKSKGFTTRINSLDADAQNVLIGIVQKLTSDNTISNADFWLEEKDGKIGIYLTDSKKLELGRGMNFVGNINQVGVNYNQQPSVKEKRKVIAGEESMDDLSTNPSDWKKEGSNWRYKDGKLFNSKGKLIKK